MKKLLLFLLILPLVVYSQTKPKPTANSGAKKPATTAQKAPVKKPAGTTAAAPKKVNPKVKELVDQAYKLYNDTKDVECEKVIKQILVLDPKNKDAFLLRANIAMFAFKYDQMWENLNKLYKIYPAEPEVYSNFALTHLTYYLLSDSAKQAMCRKTIRLASNRAEGYATLGMVVASGGAYEDALSCFDIAMKKNWKDTNARTLLNLTYANCLYSMGDTAGAVERIKYMIPLMPMGKDRYTCLYLKVKYMLEMSNTNVTEDLDTLNNYAPGQLEVNLLNVQYLGKTNKRDSACKLARQIRELPEAEGYDISTYCDDITQKIDMNGIKRLTYSYNGKEFLVDLTKFDYPNALSFAWTEVGAGAKSTRGIISMLNSALDSSYTLETTFKNDDVVLNKSTALWLSQDQLEDIQKDSLISINVSGINLSKFKMVGNLQLSIYDAKDKEFYLNCKVLYDGETRIWYLNDKTNPLVVRIETEGYNLELSKVE